MKNKSQFFLCFLVLAISAMESWAEPTTFREKVEKSKKELSDKYNSYSYTFRENPKVKDAYQEQIKKMDDLLKKQEENHQKFKLIKGKMAKVRNVVEETAKVFKKLNELCTVEYLSQNEENISKCIKQYYESFNSSKKLIATYSDFEKSNEQKIKILDEKLISTLQSYLDKREDIVSKVTEIYKTLVINRINKARSEHLQEVKKRLAIFDDYHKKHQFKALIRRIELKITEAQAQKDLEERSQLHQEINKDLNKMWDELGLPQMCRMQPYNQEVRVP